MFSFDTSVNLTNIRVNVTHFVHQPAWEGSAWDCDSDLDYYGYTEMEWDVEILEDCEFTEDEFSFIFSAEIEQRIMDNYT